MRQDWEPEDLTEVWTLLEDDMKRVRRLELPADLFADVPEKLVDAWRARASKEYPANLERMKPPGPHRAQPAPLP
ncbi:hypothetical protein KQH42_19290 [Streptomyces sp. CHA1]|uniref:hypothetical protein n=1 Tax=Streptomyces TaxID=1883 RepID=UPI0003C2D82E|nr:MULTISPECIES: hypothetical protein [unclassified Streptomyces]QPA01063.1 hypothetical protein DI273_20450 [Streptomyces violascens]WSB20625.1 hypothetical protein OHB02_10530 [Streptomyces albidoflavus]ESP97811.1 transposase [Streptomyces sp. GBA 94-10 4N24]MBT3156169.1 hypothetical protein [Streptomyces sp. G11C]MCO6702510.1 hypothetical protein [Streptomyces sp. CHB9.2]